MAQHAILSASAAHRWLNCPPSARLEETLPDSDSEFAAEGRLAHSIAELRLRRRFHGREHAGEMARAMLALQADPLCGSEMLEATAAYEDYIALAVASMPGTPHIAIEKTLDYSAYAPGGFGTADCVLLQSSALLVCDFKYGRGVPVSAERNPQLMLYALGALEAYGFLYGIETVKLAVAQPRLGIIAEWSLPMPELMAWGESIRPTAQLAWEGRGAFAAGDWCRFCRAKATCRARSGHYLALEGRPLFLTNDQIGDVLTRAQGLANWVKALEDHALAQCLAGLAVPGWKAVEGRRMREIQDFDAAVAALKAAGYDAELFYRRTAAPMGDIERILGKKKFNELLSPFLSTAQGKPTLVPAWDRRDPLTQIDAATEFKDLESEAPHADEPKPEAV